MIKFKMALIMFINSSVLSKNIESGWLMYSGIGFLKTSE